MTQNEARRAKRLSDRLAELGCNVSPAQVHDLVGALAVDVKLAEDMGAAIEDVESVPDIW